MRLFVRVPATSRDAREAAKRKFELLTTTRLSTISSTESYRISSFTLFKYYLLDPAQFFSILALICLCRVFVSDICSSSFISLFVALFYLIYKHLDSYRSFSVVRKNLDRLSIDEIALTQFLATRLGCESRRGRAQGPGSLNDFLAQRSRVTADVNTKQDSFNWINEIVAFFWPHLSQVIHVELDEFFRKEIQSGAMASSGKGSIKLLYSIISQMTTNVLAIERCQLGRQSPIIRDLKAFDDYQEASNNAELGVQPCERKLPRRSLAYDVDFDYHGDMSLSVIYRHCYCLKSRIGLKDVFLHFKLRVILGPLKKNLPFIERLSLTLLGLPDFGYKGIALAELAELKIARRLINRVIRTYLLSPKSVTVNIDEAMRKADKEPTNRKPPAKIKSSSIRLMTGGLLRVDKKVRSTGEKKVSCCTRWTAKTLLCSCLCSNYCLRICSGTRSTID